MKVDEQRTKQARKAQERGMKVLDVLFGYSLYRAPINSMTGRALETKKDRRTYREWRDSNFPARVKRRRRRKIEKASRRKNR